MTDAASQRALLEQAVQHHQAGRLAQAEQLYRQILAQNPRQHDSLHLLGVIAIQTGHLADGVKLIEQSIAIRPSATSWCNLAKAHGDLKQFRACAHAYENAHRMDPKNVGTLTALADAQRLSGEFEAALATSEKAIATDPRSAHAHNMRGIALNKLGRMDDALQAYETARQLAPNWSSPYNNAGNILRERGDHAGALALYREAAKREHATADTSLNLANALLLAGEFEAGWREYECRFGAAHVEGSYRTFAAPRWRGMIDALPDMTGKTVLLHAEQGMGDTIQFIRYAPLAAEKFSAAGARVVVESQRALHRTLQSVRGNFELIARGDVVPQLDFQIPLLSLPGIFGTRAHNIPWSGPYLRAENALAARWRERLKDARELRVGLTWAGSTTHTNDARRSIALRMMEPLMRVPGARFYSLQKGDRARELTALGWPVTDWSAELFDFADTAALIANLDLVISVDTSVCHLAGALGVRVWTLIPIPTDWRWLLDRADSPWYPTMRLFRQRAPGEWSDVIAHVAQELAHLK